MSKKLRFLSCFVAVFALALMAFSPVAFAAPEKGEAQESAPGKEKKEETSSESSSAPDSSESTGSTSASEDQGSSKRSSKSKGPRSGTSEESSSGTSENSANSPAPSDSGSGKPVHGCDQANAGYDHDYASTCDGSPSQNGSGDGNASGKPCAGCVGAADNKNPKGQRPNGSDHNNGYECDGNQGIAKGNPAHTACEPTDTNPPKCPDGSEMPADGKCDEDEVTCPDGSEMPPSGDIEDCDEVRPDIDENPSNPEDEVLGERIDRGQNPAGPSVLGALTRPVAVAGAQLPFTGGELLVFLAAALGLIAAGVVALKLRSNES